MNQRERVAKAINTKLVSTVSDYTFIGPYPATPDIFEVLADAAIAAMEEPTLLAQVIYAIHNTGATPDYQGSCRDECEVIHRCEAESALEVMTAWKENNGPPEITEFDVDEKLMSWEKGPRTVKPDPVHKEWHG